jgi:hypothetical protein
MAAPLAAALVPRPRIKAGWAPVGTALALAALVTDAAFATIPFGNGQFWRSVLPARFTFAGRQHRRDKGCSANTQQFGYFHDQSRQIKVLHLISAQMRLT